MDRLVNHMPLCRSVGPFYLQLIQPLTRRPKVPRGTPPARRPGNLSHQRLAQPACDVVCHVEINLLGSSELGKQLLEKKSFPAGLGALGFLALTDAPRGSPGWREEKGPLCAQLGLAHVPVRVFSFCCAAGTNRSLQIHKF